MACNLFLVKWRRSCGGFNDSGDLMLRCALWELQRSQKKRKFINGLF